MRIQKIQLNNFRCFQNFDVTFEASIILLSGLNGAGKTSLLEALHYACYLRSFRTHVPKELMHFNQQHFFIKVIVDAHEDFNHEIQVGFSGKKRMVKIDQKAINSYKELLDYYRVITLTEDDLVIIKGGPEERRLFIDQALMLDNPEFIVLLKTLKQVVQQRNSLLSQQAKNSESLAIWTEQLWRNSIEIQARRKLFIASLSEQMNRLLDQWFDSPLIVSLEYRGRIDSEQSFEEFLNNNYTLLNQESIMQRSLFGAHLDDFTINMQGKKSKLYASRGQQKLILLLLKVAQLKELARQKGDSIFLLDDFMNDFDQERAQQILDLLISLKSQLIFTSPVITGFFENKLLEKGCQQAIISN